MKIYLLLLYALTIPAMAQTINEKKASLTSNKEGELVTEDLLQKVNADLPQLRAELDQYYAKGLLLTQAGAPEEEYRQVLDDANRVKTQILTLENKWRESAVGDSKREEEGYALWDQEETTLAQLVMEYGAMDYLYIVPPEMSGIKLNMHSGIPIPRESWSEVLEIILNHNGVGVKKLNPYARQLYILKQDPSSITQVAARPSDLRFIPNNTRLFYIFSPPVEQARSAFQFFERFSDPKQTFLYQVANKIAMVSSKEEVEKLLTLYNTVWKDQKGKVSRVVAVSKMSAKEMEKILTSFFGDTIDKGKMPFAKIDAEGLNVQTLGHGNALILIGSQELVDRAEKIVHETEDQLQEPSEMTVYIYSCRHTDPADLAKVLEKVYSSLLITNPEPGKEIEVSTSTKNLPPPVPDGYAPSSPLVVAPPPLKTGTSSKTEIDMQASDHFIPDPKTGSLLMVVRRDALSKIKDLLHKLDIPKKMVQIEVLLFEKTINNHNGYGLNLLRIGSNNALKYASSVSPRGPGVLEFLFHKHSTSSFPRYDIAYSFLMMQDDIQLNAAPSIITVNQTPATINIVDEISINNGAAPVDTNKGTTFEKSFSRQQYGISIVMNPTIHLPDDEVEGEEGFVTLETNITFDTPHHEHHNNDDRPQINRRHIENEVRVVDGQTVVIGGLRKKTTQDSYEKIPFLGDLPLLGRLFGSTKLIDKNTEMYFFITPTIIQDPKAQLDQFRTEELKKRPGDLPEFLQAVVAAREKERARYFSNSLKLYFGRDNNYP